MGNINRFVQFEAIKSWSSGLATGSHWQRVVLRRRLVIMSHVSTALFTEHLRLSVLRCGWTNLFLRSEGHQYRLHHEVNKQRPTTTEKAFAFCTVVWFNYFLAAKQEGERRARPIMITGLRPAQIFLSPAALRSLIFGPFAAGYQLRGAKEMPRFHRGRLPLLQLAAGEEGHRGQVSGFRSRNLPFRWL